MSPNPGAAADKRAAVSIVPESRANSLQRSFPANRSTPRQRFQLKMKTEKSKALREIKFQIQLRRHEISVSAPQAQKLSARVVHKPPLPCSNEKKTVAAVGVAAVPDEIGLPEFREVPTHVPKQPGQFIVVAPIP